MQLPGNRFDSVSGQGDSKMSEPNLQYFEEEDVLHLVLSEEKESGSAEIGPHITAELNENGEIIGVEILNASRFIRDTILDSAQVRLLRDTPTSAP